MGKKKYAWKGFNIDKNGNIYCSPNGNKKYYKLGEITKQSEELKLCGNGIHFCWNMQDVMDYYNFGQDDMVLGKIEILGDVIDGKDKSVTNKIRVVRLYPSKKQRMNISNIGKDNTGYCNTGYCNTGNRNTGNRNTGHCNTGNRNTGYWNTGNRNTGYCNTGYWNTGNRNTGYWNSCNFSNGLFCTQSPKINLFNKPTNYTMEEFKQTKWYDSLTNGNFELTKWVEYPEEEMKADERLRNTGGKTIAIPYKEACQNWWNSLDDEDKEIIQTMPNFDKKIFKEITGIEL